MLDQNNRQVKLIPDPFDQLQKIMGLLGFMPAAGSSSSRSFGLVAKALVISRRRCSP